MLAVVDASTDNRASTLTQQDGPDAGYVPVLAQGVALLGAYKDSGCVQAPYLIRRADGGMLEVSALLHMVATAIDGRRDLGDIARVVVAGTGREIRPEDVGYLVREKLGPLGVIAGLDRRPGPASGRTSAPASALAVRRAVVPQRFVRAATTVLRPLFRPFVVVAVLAAFLAVDAWLLVVHGIPRALHQVAAQPELFLLVTVLTVVAGAFHELGHATASRYGGAEPGALGVGVYLLWPVFWNDVNDSYRLSRGGRLRADLGGVYFNVVFTVAMAALYGLTGLEPLLVVVAVQHLVILQQFVPFVRLDGYYVVSDLVGVPDLSGRIRPVLASLVPGRQPDRRVAGLKPHARRVVTLWVLLTVPLLAASAVWLAIRLPVILRASVVYLVLQARALGDALAAGDLVAMLVAGVGVLAPAVPLVGMVLTAARAARRMTPGRAWAGLVRDTGRRRAVLGFAVAVHLFVAVTAAAAVAAGPGRMAPVVWRAQAVHRPTAVTTPPASELVTPVDEAPAASTPVPVTTTTTTSRRQGPATTAVSAGRSTPPASPVPTTAPTRPQPSTGEVSRAIALFRQRIPFYQPTEAQVRRFGDVLCTAFDEGRPYGEVRAGVQSAVSRIPLVTVSPGDVELAVRATVTMFCPVYAGKLP